MLILRGIKEVMEEFAASGVSLCPVVRRAQTPTPAYPHTARSEDTDLGW